MSAWVRIATRWRTDNRLRHLSDDQFRVWFNLMCYAQERGNEGGVIDDADDGFLLGVEVSNGDDELLNATLAFLEVFGIIEVSHHSGLETGDPDIRVITWTDWLGGGDEEAR